MIPPRLIRTRKQIQMWNVFSNLERMWGSASAADIFFRMQHLGVKMGEVQIRRVLLLAWKDGALLKVGYGKYRSLEWHAEMGKPSLEGGFRDRNPDGSWRRPEARLGQGEPRLAAQAENGREEKVGR